MIFLKSTACPTCKNFTNESFQKFPKIRKISKKYEIRVGIRIEITTGLFIYKEMMPLAAIL